TSSTQVSGVAGIDKLACFQEARFEPYFAHLLLFVHDSLPVTYNGMRWGWCRYEFHVDTCVGYRGQWIDTEQHTDYSNAYSYTLTKPHSYADACSNSHPSSNPQTNANTAAHAGSHPNTRESNHDPDRRDSRKYKRGDYVRDAGEREYGNVKRQQSRYPNAALSGRNHEDLRSFHGVV